jgi:exodeoxyribonuclease V gamma subunit
VLVRELRDYLDQAYRAPGGQGIVGQITARHMLHPFHPGYFSASRDAEPGQFSYSRFDARVAQILRDQEETRQPRPFFTQLLPPLREPDVSSQPVELTLRDLITFFRNPCRYFLRHRLRTDPPLEHDQVNDTELFTVNGLQRFQLLQLLLNEQLGGGDPRACYPALLNRGLLPHGEPGRIAFLDLCGDLASFGEMLQPLLQPGSGESPEPVLDFEGHDPRFHLTGVLPPVRARGPVHFRPSSLKTGLWMEAWITHLAHNYAAPDLPAEQRQSWLAGYDDKKPSLYRLEPLPPDDAAARLTELARIALSADRRPPRFFPRASWAYAHKLTHPKTAEEPEAAAMREARKVFHPRKFPDRGQPGDLEDPAIAAFYDNTTNRPQNRPDPATPDQVPVPHVDLGDPLDQSFRSLSETIFLPLLKTSSKVGD